MRIKQFRHTPLFVAMALTLTSCEQHLKLFLEKANLETEVQQQKEETAQYEAKFATLNQPPDYAVANLDQQVQAVEKDVTALSQEVAALDSKVTAIEQALKNYRPKVDAFKAASLK